MLKRFWLVVLVCFAAAFVHAGTDSAGVTVNAGMFSSIQEAQDALPQTGGELLVPCGTYGELNITKSNVVVHGSGDCSLVAAGAVQDNAITLAPGLANVTLEGLNVQGAWTGTKDEWDEAHIYIGNAVYAAGTEAFPITNLTIQNNRISNGNNGLMLRHVIGGTVTGNRFSNVTVASLGQATILTSTNILVSNNTFTDSAKSANAVYLRGDGGAFGSTGLDTGDSYITLINNTATGAYSYEVLSLLDSHHVVITHNTLTVRNGGGNSVGVQIQETSHGSQPDTVSQTYHNSVTDNVIDIEVASPGNGNNGIVLGDQSGAWEGYGANDSEISGNTIRMAGRGINISLNCKRNLVSNNDVTITTRVFGFDGIGVSDASATDNRIIGNTVRNATGNGISNYGTRTYIERNRVSGGVYSNGAALYMPATAGGAAVIVDNTFTGNAGRGVSIDSPVKDVDLQGNIESANALPDYYPGVSLRIVSRSSSLTIKPGEKGVVKLATSVILSQPGSGTLSCVGLPVGAQCLFSPSAVGLVKDTAVTMTLTTTRASATKMRPNVGGWILALLVPGLAVMTSGSRGRRIWLAVGILLLMVLSFTGCGTSSGAGTITAVNLGVGTSVGVTATTAGNYSVIVSATTPNGIKSSVVVKLAIVD